MKILNLYFKNINSLEGENRIDFEQSPFTDTGVFAITGPNGSGKSSILDAITLALYGETFRFDKPAQHIITQHTNESFAQIEFALGHDKFRSSWHVKRKDGNPWGDVLPTEMQLAYLNDSNEPIATTPQAVCERIADITGMNFRSFTRSILLAQGDFAAFLNALETERMDILEKIVGTDIYADYKKEAADKLAEAEKQLTFLQQDLAAVPLIEPESLAACELDLADFSEQVSEYQEVINNLAGQKASFAETASIRNQIEAQESRLQAAITQRLSVQKQLDQLSSAEKASAFKEDLEARNQFERSVVQENTALAALRNELKQLEATLALPGYDVSTLAQTDFQPGATDNPPSFTDQKQTIDEIRSQVNLLNANWQSEIILQRSLSAQITEKQAALNEVSTWLTEHAIEQPLLQGLPELDRLKNLRAALVENASKKQSLAKWSKSINASFIKNKAIADKKNKALEDLNQDLTEQEQALNEIAQGNTLIEIEDLYTEQAERLKAFEELVSLALANDNLSPQKSFFFSLFGKNIAPGQDAEELEVELEALTQQLKQEENIRLALERAVSNDAVLARMAPDRIHLVDGKPCPLCGAFDHPYAKHPPAPANTQQALLDQRIKIKRINLKLSELTEQVKLARKYAERNQARSNQRQQIKARWHTLCNQLNTASADLDIKNTGLMKQLQKTEATDLKNIATLISNYKSIQNRITKLKTAIQNNIATTAQVQNTLQNIEAEWQTEPQRMAETDAESTKLQQEEQDLLAKLTEQLTAVGETIPPSGKETALAERLTIRRQDYESYHVRSNSLITELEQLQSQQVAGQTQIDSYKARLDGYNKQLQSAEVVGLHLALVEKQKLIADKEHHLAQLQAEAEIIDLAINQKMQGTPFTSADEISHILAMLETQPDLAEQKIKLDDEVKLLGAELDGLYGQLESDESSDKPEISEEEIDSSLKATKEKLELAQLEAERLEKIIREQNQYKERYATLLAQLENQQTLVQQENAEVAEMAAQSGMAFRRRVQERMIERLLSQTNATLEKISGRYYLRQKPSDRGLALEIEDTYQGNVRRLPKTLSGGESFIVSLALALGLSELASSGKSVDSLFLDEGFGNLDAETLYTVINTLEGLRAHGKTVGVISHVEAVQKRFKAQLQLVKKPNGLGELRKVS